MAIHSDAGTPYTVAAGRGCGCGGGGGTPLTCAEGGPSAICIGASGLPVPDPFVAAGLNPNTTILATHVFSPTIGVWSGSRDSTGGGCPCGLGAASVGHNLVVLCPEDNDPAHITFAVNGSSQACTPQVTAEPPTGRYTFELHTITWRYPSLGTGVAGPPGPSYPSTFTTAEYEYVVEQWEGNSFDSAACNMLSSSVVASGTCTVTIAATTTGGDCGPADGGDTLPGGGGGGLRADSADTADTTDHTADNADGTAMPSAAAKTAVHLDVLVALPCPHRGAREVPGPACCPVYACGLHGRVTLAERRGVTLPNCTDCDDRPTEGVPNVR